MSGGYDATVKIHRLEASGAASELQREVCNLFGGRQVRLLELSPYHNLFVVATRTNQICVFEYEFCRLLALIELDATT